ncbi:SNF2-related protein [Dactylosporangium sp. NPDC000521]|uniref:SNF2-related protein n=1 Tax=Dactylosporangium sp. NPDC000521 TaxID=3363975 RepID=UPI0036CCEB6A
MNVVHGVITGGGRLAYWAETTPGPASGLRRRPRRAVPHPFAVLPPLPGDVATADLALPTTGARPLPSPTLTPPAATDRDPDTTGTMLWTVPIVYAPPGTDLEAALTTGTAVVAGPSIGALTDLVTLAADLVHRGRVLPDLLDHPIEARWRPVLWADDAIAFESLCRSMPGVACAARDWTPEEAVRAALDHQVDALVRAALAGRPIITDAAVRQDSTVRAWLAALTSPDPTLRERPAPDAGAATREPPSHPAPQLADRPHSNDSEHRQPANHPSNVDNPGKARNDGSLRGNGNNARSGNNANEASDGGGLHEAGSSNDGGNGTNTSEASHGGGLRKAGSSNDGGNGTNTSEASHGGGGLREAGKGNDAGNGDSVAEPADGNGPDERPDDERNPANSHSRPVDGRTSPGSDSAISSSELRNGARPTGSSGPNTDSAPTNGNGPSRYSTPSTGDKPNSDNAPSTNSNASSTANTPNSGSALNNGNGSSSALNNSNAPRTGSAPSTGNTPNSDNAPSNNTNAPSARDTPSGGSALSGGSVAVGSGGVVGRAVRESTDVRRVRDEIRRWAESGRPAAVRLCFRLTFVEEFDEGEDDAGAAGEAGVRVDGERDVSGWLVEFMLQPVAEPGLLVPAKDVWRSGSSPLFRWVDYPQDVLLADLGRASRLWPELDEALHHARPEQLRLDTIGAYCFLRHAGMLHDAGFGVILPAQWQRRQDLGLTLTTHTAQPAAPVLRDTTANRAAIVRFRWGLAIGDEFLSEADLRALARAKVPLVRLRGRWVHLDREKLRAGLAFLARGGHGHMSAGEAMRLVRLVPEGDLPLPVTGVDGTGWLADLLTGRAVERLELLEPPASLATTLRPYQRKGLSWLAFLDGLGVGALLADDMGLGKTVQVLALEALLRERGPRPPTLIVCPLSVLGNWRREIGRFTPGLRVAVHHGTERAMGEHDDADLVLTTYQVATRDVDRLAARDWDRIVLDEAQQVKNSTGAAARAVRRIPARHRVALTGTPVENRLTELWSIADFLNPGILGPASIFRARYSVPVERYADADAAARLRRVTRPFLLRRVKTDRAVIADLPDKFERRQWCNLTLEQATLYKAVVNELFVKLREGRSGERRKGLVLSAMTKLKQVCNHPAHLMGDGTPLAGRSGKLARLEEILATALDAGDRALVFTQFAKFGHLLAPYLAGRLGTGVEFLHGGTAKGARDAMVERFQTGKGPGVLLLSLKAGGTGLNLTAANHVVHVDRWWNPATEQQATDRAFRIGQRRDVQVHTFVCVGTIEERVDTIMAEKRTLAGVAVGSGEGWLTGLSTDDLLDLMTLRTTDLHEATDA